MMVFSSYRPHASRCCAQHYRNSISLDRCWKFRARCFLRSIGLATCGKALFLSTSKAHKPIRIQPIIGIYGQQPEIRTHWVVQ